MGEPCAVDNCDRVAAIEVTFRLLRVDIVETVQVCMPHLSPSLRKLADHNDAMETAVSQLLGDNR
jgi:hypothetical protein